MHGTFLILENKHNFLNSLMQSNTINCLLRVLKTHEDINFRYKSLYRLGYRQRGSRGPRKLLAGLGYDLDSGADLPAQASINHMWIFKGKED